MTERLHFHLSLSCIGEGNGNPLQCSCLENPRDKGAWWAAVSGVAQSPTRLKQLSRELRSSGSSSSSSRESNLRPLVAQRKYCVPERARLPCIRRARKTTPFFIHWLFGGCTLNLRTYHGHEDWALHRPNTTGVIRDFIMPLSLLQHLVFLALEKSTIILRFLALSCYRS